MKTYNVQGIIGATTSYVEIEANSPDEAIEKFWDHDAYSPSICINALML